jgi:hypothetical protein
MKIKFFFFFLFGFMCLGYSSDLQELREQLKSNDFVKVSKAARALESLGEDVLPNLIKWLNEDDSQLSKRSFVLICKISKNKTFWLRSKYYLRKLEPSLNLHQEAINKYLNWLISKQNPDGSWSEKSKLAMTSLASLSLLSQGQMLTKPQKESLVKSLRWLVTREIDVIKNQAYPHAIKTLALVEAYKTYEIKGLKEHLVECLKYLVDGLQDNGSYNYRYRTDEDRQDFSFSHWNYQSLYLAHQKGIEVQGLLKSLNKGADLYKEYTSAGLDFPYTIYKGSRKSYNGVHQNFRGLCSYLLLSKNSSVPKKYKDEIKSFIGDLNLKGRSPKYKFHRLYYSVTAVTLAEFDNIKVYNKIAEEFISLQKAESYWISEYDTDLSVELERIIYSSYYAVRALASPYLYPAN